MIEFEEKRKPKKDEIKKVNCSLRAYEFKTPDVEIRRVISDENVDGRRIVRYSSESMSKEKAKEKYGDYKMFQVLKKELDNVTTIAYIREERYVPKRYI